MLKTGAQFDGDTYTPMLDYVRLTGLLSRVYFVMEDGRWHTLGELSVRAVGSEASVSARLRDLRKAKFGSFQVDRERVKAGLWRYRLKLSGQQGRLF